MRVVESGRYVAAVILETALVVAIVERLEQTLTHANSIVYKTSCLQLISLYHTNSLQVNSIEFPMPLQYDMSQAGLPVRDVSHQYNNYLSPHGTSKEKDHIASTDEKSSLLSSSVSSQRLAYQPDLSNFHVEGRCANQYGSAANQDTARNIITNTHSRNMDNSRNWHSQLLHGQMSDVFGPDQSTAEMYSRNSYQYSQNQEQVPRQQMIRTDSVTSLGIAALDPCMPPVLVDRQLPIPTGGRIVGSTAMSELTPNHSSILSSHGLNGMNTEHNTVYGKATSTWANKNGINHPLCNSPGSMLSNELRNPSTITEGETCDNSGLSPMSCVSPQCTPEPYRSPSAHPVTTGINNPASLAGRDFPHRANTMPSKHGIPPSLYSFSSDYPRQEPCYESSFEGSLGNGQKCTPLY